MVSDVIDSNFLIVSENPVVNNVTGMRLVNNIRIEMYGEVFERPQKLTFTSGNTYFLSDGYSITYYAKLSTTAAMSVV
jgi:ethanolamine utilization cobalamin adenosyltransferase